MQLVAQGAQDVYLTGEPQISFFKVVYRRHTNFAIECIEQSFAGSAGLGNNVSATIARNGDLIAGMHLQVLMPEIPAPGEYMSGVGHMLIETCEVEIGGQKIDKHYAEWLDIWDELTGTSAKLSGYGEMVAKNYTPVTASAAVGSGFPGGNAAGDYMYIPLQFWFNRNPGLALPLIALQYHEVKILIKFAPAETLAVDIDVSGVITSLPFAVPSTGFEAKLFVDYIYLDTEERRRFAQMSHEYLIDQLQFTGSESVTAGSSKTIRLNFNHPVKELVWVFRADSNGQNNDWLNFYPGVGSINEGLVEVKLQLNGHDRAVERPGSYYRLIQPWSHHTRIPQKPVYSYSFALRPEEHQPSGTCNFSRIDNATLKVEIVGDAGWGSPVSLYVFAVNYNVLRVVSGMGGLAYSN